VPFWTQRVFTSTAAQNTPDADGKTRFVERRARKGVPDSFGQAIANWGFGGQPASQGDLHWNGSAWTSCAFNHENLNSPRDAQGRGSYDYCDKFDTGSSTRSVFDVSGKSMADVYNQIVTAGYTNITIANYASVLGTSAFPANSKLLYQSNTSLATAPAYSPSINGALRNSSAAVAAGKASASDTTAACASIGPGTSSYSYTSEATTLEGVVAANPGTPCVYSPGSITITTVNGTASVPSGPRNEWWSQSTLTVGIVGNAPTGGVQSGHYTTNTIVRVAFGAGNEARYYSCQQRSTDGSARNCDLTGTGTYSIATLGDARILSLANTPAQAASLAERVFVERGGKVYFGYKSRTGSSSSARLNLDAANALLTTLGMQVVDPTVPNALTPASYQGEWVVRNASATDASSTSVIIPASYTGSNTAYQCIEHPTENLNAGTQFTCALTLNPATGQFTLVDTVANDGQATGTLDLSTGEMTGTFTPTTGTPEALVGRRR
jgi:hypothetical protein